MSIKNDGHYFCRAGGNRPDGLNEPVTVQIPEQINTLPDSLCCELVLPAGTLRLKGKLTPA
ncbi:hypothetical protein ED722_24885, partial [Escherichia coli]|nr:hypothetical protein [Escherichia coli]